MIFDDFWSFLDVFSWGEFGLAAYVWVLKSNKKSIFPDFLFRMMKIEVSTHIVSSKGNDNWQNKKFEKK